MWPIQIPLEKRRATVARNEGRNDFNSNTYTVNMEVAENSEIQEKNSNVDNLQSNREKKSLHENEEVVHSDEKRVPPPYVVWIQFMGWGQEQPPTQIYLIEDLKTRNSFIRKVFLIVLIMLLLTAGLCAAIHLVEPVREIFIQNGFVIIIPAFIILISLTYALDFVNCTRQAPCSYICLLLAVVCSAVLCVVITLRTRTILVYYVLAATVVVVIFCFLLACSKFDFTKLMLYIVMIGAALCVILFLFLIGNLVFGIYLKPMYIVLLIMMTILNVVALAMQLQMILGGRTVELGIEEYTIGAFMVYMSIIDIFLKLLLLANVFDR